MSWHPCCGGSPSPPSSAPSPSGPCARACDGVSQTFSVRNSTSLAPGWVHHGAVVEQQVPVTAGTLDGQVGEELVARASARARRWAAAAEEGPDRISSARQLSPAARLAALLHDPV